MFAISGANDGQTDWKIVKKNNKFNSGYVVGYVKVAAFAATFITVACVTAAGTGVHSLWIYCFGSEERKARRRAEMAYRRSNTLFDFD